jgi:hypothetical protein
LGEGRAEKNLKLLRLGVEGAPVLSLWLGLFSALLLVWCAGEGPGDVCTDPMFIVPAEGDGPPWLFRLWSTLAGGPLSLLVSVLLRRRTKGSQLMEEREGALKTEDGAEYEEEDENEDDDARFSHMRRRSLTV